LKKIVFLALSVMLVTTACAPDFSKEEEVVQKTDDNKQKAVISKYSISDDTYQSVLPFKESKSRGLTVSNLNTRLDVKEFESGLTRLSKDEFSTDDYYYQEGQYLDEDTISSWLRRKWTENQYKDVLKDYDKEERDKVKNVGLNPINTGEGTAAEQSEKSPIYLAHILEQDYLVKDGDELKLGGVSIGLAMNSVYYYTQEKGYPREKKISREKLQEEGEKMADEIVQRMRKIKGLENVPITVGLFEQEEKSSLEPGSYFAKATAKKGSSELGSWDKVDEGYYLFPSNAVAADERSDSDMFGNFKAEIQDYFPNYTNIIGRGFYQNGELQEMTIDIPIQFFGEQEITGFTQYIAGLVMEHFPSYLKVNVNISTVQGPEALISREPDEKKPFVHIYK
jgi:protein involved in sex pheromone biosynthesis